MCGLVGMFGGTPNGLTQMHLKVMAQLLVVDTLRGTDSTGAFAVHKSSPNIAALHKKTGAGWGFVQGADYNTFEDFLWNKARFVVGHNRAATRGSISDETAHPFHEGNILLVHNGTLGTHWKELCNYDATITVDSQAIAWALNNAKDWREVLPEIDGAYTLIWYDFRDETLRFASNGERPLWFAFDTENNMYWASEYQMLDSILTRNSIKVKELPTGGCFFPIPKFEVLEFKVGDVPNFTASLLGERYEKQKKPVHFQKATGSTTCAGSQTTKCANPPALPDEIDWDVYDIDPGKKTNRVTVVGWGLDAHGEYVEVRMFGRPEVLNGLLSVGTKLRSSTSYLKVEGGITTVYVKDFAILTEEDSVDEGDPVGDNSLLLDAETTTKSGTTISYSKWSAMRYQVKDCHHCSQPVSFDELFDSELKYNGDFVHHLLCPVCSAELQNSLYA